jgi:hypothetical protein
MIIKGTSLVETERLAIQTGLAGNIRIVRSPSMRLSRPPRRNKRS